MQLDKIHKQMFSSTGLKALQDCSPMGRGTPLEDSKTTNFLPKENLLTIVKSGAQRS